ncbi:hypothetical protein WPS_10080 [Vulcanimicrobium alpinum]|uniref:Uncharacterized protein n=1 Tax=Vulcanimicrobium alpinum TaxID=3016050 RepID=A0AAN1XUH1_UNVUL|nr:hypothetical protein [Vulcanimicrobium alpinum]BDE05732.1 hypothetical protein WPS_10080 [Vulcanimicrobium alpinum]
MRQVVFRFRVLALALLATGCVSSAPRLYLPYELEANCESRSVKQTAINSIVASIDDTIRPGTYPGDAVMRPIVHRGGGVIARWHDQPLRAPDTAKALGVNGDLILRRAVITNQINVAQHWRPVWLTFATPRGDVTVLERAYDIQDVCIEGTRQA